MFTALTTLVLAGSLVALPAPGAVIIDEIDGLSVLDDRLELDLEAYRRWAPELVDHIDPAAEAAAGFEGAYRVWGGDGIDGVIDNVTLWSSTDDADRYVDQAVSEAVKLGLTVQNSPFDDVVMFEGEDIGGDFYTYLTWRHETYGIAMVAVGEDLNDTVVDAAREQQAALEAALTPPVAGQATGDDSPDDAEGGSGIISILVLVMIVTAMSWMYIRLRRASKQLRIERQRATTVAEQPEHTDGPDDEP